MSQEQGSNRREFLKGVVAGGVALSTAEALAFTGMSKSKVVLAKDAALRVNGALDATRLSALLDRAMQAAFVSKDALAPWKQLVKPAQVVGLKVNTIAGPGLSTNVALVNAIAARLQQAGIEPYNIIVWDRTARELERAGFTLSSAPGKVRVMGTDAIGYEETPEQYGSAKAPLSKILTRLCDVVIGVPILKDHSGAGVTVSMKNMYGVIQNPRDHHSNGCIAVADVAMLPTIRRKVRFTICDATSACYHGGPGNKPEYVWHPDSILAGADPVALDHTAWQIIERKRAELGLKALEADGRAPRYIATAADAQHQLGTNDPNRIALIEV
jgi:uncharacterized protein (DUF362 family)